MEQKQRGSFTIVLLGFARRKTLYPLHYFQSADVLPAKPWILWSTGGSTVVIGLGACFVHEAIFHDVLYTSHLPLGAGRQLVGCGKDAGGGTSGALGGF